MRLKQRETDSVDQPRYGADMLQKVAALATRLQGRMQETLTAREIEAIGAEAGLDPVFIQQALGQLTAGQPGQVMQKSRATEFWSPVAAFGAALLWGALGLACSPNIALMRFCSLAAPAPLAVLLGFLAGGRGAASAVGVTLVLASAPTLEQMLLRVDPPSVLGVWLYLILGGPLGGWLAWQGARIRDHYFPVPSARLPVSRPALLNLLFSLQRQLEGQKQRRAFLSVDVVGSSEMKRNGPELAVEHSFGQYRSWMEDVVRAHGGEMQSAAGDGIMALFPTDTGAVRAARLLQEELTRFNQEQNRLPQPFQIRCGVSAGEVAIEEGMPLGHLQSPVIDRAAALQKRAEPGDILVSGELASAALLELGGLAPLPAPVAGEPAFSWRAGQSAHPPNLS